MFLDTVNLLMSDDPMQKYLAHIQKKSYKHKYYMAYGFNWPYFCYASKYNYIFVLNAFNPNFIQRYELPNNELTSNRVSFTFLTDTHDLFVMYEVSEGYEVYFIDLDSDHP